MNRQLFLQLLEHPDSVSATENVVLQKFTEDFPYCQTGHLLFVKHLHSQQSVHYPEQLKIAAAYVADRKVLYNLIHTAPASPLTPLQRRGENILTESVEEENIIDSITIISERREHIEKTLEQTSSDIIPEKKIMEEPTAQDDIIQKRLQEIASQKITVPVTEVQQEKKRELMSEPVSFMEEKTIDTPEIVQQKIQEEKKEVPDSGKHSFTEWLKTVKKEPEIKPKEKKEDRKPDSSTDDIINRFIETEPRIIPSKAEFYNPIKMAKQSLEERDDIVSETLAGIFAEQGNLPRAIEMYRKLMLSNPEKSSFFAALIEKLTQQLNEDK
jgi:hypothetical protein